ncbi:flagellar hook assembly protein FlgD [Pseudalkalibacillus caeni]|uniref:Flagellar hook assembly protein FlgD n=1 Tax=Exobacillus caeni TaxID=2574798 RepID=A0A5R9F2U5_9BACL|nr:flagellar hook assembly protein FlgD [Pseudalkalibacillus caeni]TLS36636.1 flagellar hook assembly protein FlgD [Pseudalkalibacillus caeni]
MNTTSASMNITTNPGQKQQSFQEKNTLGKEQFLQILVAQLSNQDPLQPMQDREFISQMAQFSGLEQMTNLNGTMNRFIDHQMQSSISENSHLIGKQIQWEDEGESKTGIVAAVLLKEGNVLAELQSGEQVEVGNITKVESKEIIEQAANENEPV